MVVFDEKTEIFCSINGSFCFTLEQLNIHNSLVCHCCKERSNRELCKSAFLLVIASFLAMTFSPRVRECSGYRPSRPRPAGVWTKSPGRRQSPNKYLINSCIESWQPIKISHTECPTSNNEVFSLRCSKFNIQYSLLKSFRNNSIQKPLKQVRPPDGQEAFTNQL